MQKITTTHTPGQTDSMVFLVKEYEQSGTLKESQIESFSKLRKKYAFPEDALKKCSMLQPRRSTRITEGANFKIKRVA
jgi:hypothetical protein